MSKAEERALEAYPVKEEWVGNQYGSYGDVNERFRGIYQEGYHQAEKDLGLSWEDMMLIHRCIKDAMNFKLYKMMEGVEGQKEVYEEVLKRFKNLKK